MTHHETALMVITCDMTCSGVAVELFTDNNMQFWMENFALKHEINLSLSGFYDDPNQRHSAIERLSSYDGSIRSFNSSAPDSQLVTDDFALKIQFVLYKLDAVKDEIATNCLEKLIIILNKRSSLFLYYIFIFTDYMIRGNLTNRKLNGVNGV